MCLLIIPNFIKSAIINQKLTTGGRVPTGQLHPELCAVRAGRRPRRGEARGDARCWSVGLWNLEFLLLFVKSEQRGWLFHCFF
jgi:hypothetical protein